MRRSNLVTIAGIIFFLVGGMITFLVVSGGGFEDDHYGCVDRGGIPVEHYDNGGVVCIDPSALR